MIRFLASIAVFVGVMLIGYALGINPSLGETIIVITACNISNGVREAL